MFIVFRDLYSAHDRLVAVYFSEHLIYDSYTFRNRFQMSRELFTSIVEEVSNHCAFFRNNIDCTGRKGISALIKSTSSIRQLTYDTVPDALDEYLQMGASTSRDSIDYCCKSIMEIYGPRYLRKYIYTDVEKFYWIREEKHGFLKMLGSLDCTYWEWLVV